MLIPPLALAFGALGLLARGHRRVIWLLVVAAPILSIVAFAAQFVPGGAEACTSSAEGTNCLPLPAVSGWGSPLPYVIAVGLILLSLAPLASVRSGKWWPAAVSALLQAVPQVVSFGGFVDWAPALVATIAVVFAVAATPPVVSPQVVGSPKH
jgi:hypothetical protein